MKVCIIATKASTLLDFVRGLRGELYVTLEEGSWAAWLHDVMSPHVQRLVGCDPRKNALLKQGNKSGKIDARKLADQLRAGLLSPVDQRGKTLPKSIDVPFETITHLPNLVQHLSADGLNRLG